MKKYKKVLIALVASLLCMCFTSCEVNHVNTDMTKEADDFYAYQHFIKSI